MPMALECATAPTNASFRPSTTRPADRSADEYSRQVDSLSKQLAQQQEYASQLEKANADLRALNPGANLALVEAPAEGTAKAKKSKKQSTANPFAVRLNEVIPGIRKVCSPGESHD
jgi:hypothetical protein